MLRRQSALTVFALIALTGALAGCASTTKSTGADTLEGGVKIPNAVVPPASETGPTTVNVTVSDTNGANGPMTPHGLTRNRARG